MKKFLLSTAALVVLASPAMAADLRPRTYTKAPAYTAPEAVYSWTGFYVGGNVGAAFGGDNAIFGSNGRFAGGIQGGADYQFARNWVVGIEANYSWLPGNNSRMATFGAGSTLTDSDRGLGSVTGRFGYTWGPALLYAKGGYAYRDNSLGVNTIGGTPSAFTASSKRDGYTVGAGLEYMFSPNWSAKAEYQYYNFGSTTINSGPADVAGANYRNDDHTVKVGLNYRFGWGGPVVAKY